MSSTQKTLIFMFQRSSFPFSCTGKEKISEMIKKFIDIYNKESKIIDYNFFYERDKINPEKYETTSIVNIKSSIIKEEEEDENEEEGEIEEDEEEIQVKKVKKEKKREKEESIIEENKTVFIISVERNIKIIQCPQCNYGDCVVSLRGYRTIFYNCEHYHLKESTYENFFTDQLYFPDRIICANFMDARCKNKNAESDNNFSLCLTCSKEQKRTINYCSGCIKRHEREKHNIIKYEDKNYYCQAHIKKMAYYCFQCKKNVCEDCAKDHQGHQYKSIDLLIPDEKEFKDLIDSTEKIKEKMKTLKSIIENLVYTLNRTWDIYDNYYKIAKHILNKYNTFNKGEKDFKNFTIFKCLHNLRISNEEILKDLDAIFEKKKKTEKAIELIKIYDKKKSDYYANTPLGNNLNKEDDSDWLKEVEEREKKREQKKKTEEDKKGEEKGGPKKIIKKKKFPNHSIHNNDPY